MRRLTREEIQRLIKLYDETHTRDAFLATATRVLTLAAPDAAQLYAIWETIDVMFDEYVK